MTIDIDAGKVERNEIGSWLGWTLATAGGMLLGFLPTILLINFLSLAPAQRRVPVFAGALLGLTQGVAGGLVAGAISAVALVRIVRKPDII